MRALWKRYGMQGIGVPEDGIEGSNVRITHVLDGGAAQKSSLAAGDLVMAMDGLRVTPDNFDNQLSRYRPGETVTLHTFRRDELHVLEVTLAAAKADAWTLSVNKDQAGALARRRWLGTN